MGVYQGKNGKWYCSFQINGERKHLLCHGAKNKKEAEDIEDGYRYKLKQQQNGMMPRDDKGVTTSLNTLKTIRKAISRIRVGCGF